MAHVTRTERVQAFLFLLIGLFVTGSVILTLAGYPFGPEPKTYYLRSTESVIGLDEGTPVRYKGKKFGKISDVDVNPDKPEEIVVTLKVDPDCPIKVSTTARISSSSIIGSYYIELLGSRKDSPDLPPGSDIPTSPSMLSRILEAGASVGDELVTLLTNLRSWTTPEQRDIFWGAVDEARQTFHSAREGIDRVAPEAVDALRAWKELGESLQGFVTENRATAEQLLRDLTASVERLRTFLVSGELEDISATTRRTLERAASEIEATGGALRGWLGRNDLEPHLLAATTAIENVSRDFRALALALEAETAGLARTDLGPALHELRGAAEAFTRALDMIRRNPRALIFGEPPPEKPLPVAPRENR